MKIDEFEGANFYLADEQNYGLFREETSPFYSVENCGNYYAFTLTIEHPALPDRAWLVFPYDDDDGCPAEAISREFIDLLKNGYRLSEAARRIKQKYFSERDYGELFDRNSSYSYDIRLVGQAV